ncbi:MULTISPECIES: helix-turn-helix domain-containing protein [Dickeya]|uniref:helix-turn-helix domain-containing protein n=1 Tax=Dickeya TaxID=204037 RepID=UPI0003A29B79|nr:MULTISPECIES: helix-turn-helix transcriptional regulator [Dickeya]MCI4202726.1 helix-turn-helix domain-containing protein [Dickeya dianthicola]MCI4214136.1 helix-turn-helix domain-containing protein [Dickeya dianthicola]MCI4225168.1 helix-turn-helix domain-containing protein [Dickeya dianthicola]WKV50855.1 helix-turn-helix domain-containing protein [Dickeya fangzhongdai]WKV50941.1 helix-turn-helix domain-containing protein [Dickeya fangzhongdai]
MWHKQLNWLCLSMTDFGKNLSAIRRQRQLTQLELASLLEVQPRMVGRWEQGQAKPQFDYVIKLAQVLEVSIDRLVFGEQGQEPPAFDIKNKRLKELCKQADALRPEDQDVICRLIDMAIRQDKLKQIIS